MQAVSIGTKFPLMAIPFATSIVLVMGSPEAELPQPRALVGGHLVSAVVGLSIIAMQMTRSFHPPADIDPLVVVVNDMSWSFLLVPVTAWVLMLTAFAFVWNDLVARAGRGLPWPTRWW